MVCAPVCMPTPASSALATSGTTGRQGQPAHALQPVRGVRSPMSWGPRSRTSPSWTTTASPPIHRRRSHQGWLYMTTSASSRLSTSLCRSPWMSPTARPNRVLSGLAAHFHQDQQLTRAHYTSWRGWALCVLTEQNSFQPQRQPSKHSNCYKICMEAKLARGKLRWNNVLA